MPVIRISEELFKEVQKYAEPLVDNFESVIWRLLSPVERNKSTVQDKVVERRVPRKRSRGETTLQKEFRKPILEALIDMGGQGPCVEVCVAVGRKMNDQLKAGDYKLNADGTKKWEKAVHFQRLAMVHEGLLADDSPRGIWQITDKGREWVSRD